MAEPVSCARTTPRTFLAPPVAAGSPASRESTLPSGSNTGSVATLTMGVSTEPMAPTAPSSLMRKNT